jgi:Leucine-rich repeat (LRR) protein
LYQLQQGLTAVPAGLCSLAVLAELNLYSRGLMSLPEGMEALAGLKRLDLSDNRELTVLPAKLGRLRNLEELDLDDPGLATLHDMRQREGLLVLLAHLAA